MDTPDDTVLPASTLGNPFLFTGREYDAATGLLYYRARYLDPRTGTFLQEDPIAKLSVASRYVYVNNNPLNFIDPYGEQPIPTCAVCGEPGTVTALGLPGLPRIPPPLPPPPSAQVQERKDVTTCPAEDQDAGEAVICERIDRGPTVCIYNCNGRIVTIPPPVPGEEGSCPRTIIYRLR
jgi:RHS repeat-associated protein